MTTKINREKVAIHGTLAGRGRRGRGETVREGITLMLPTEDALYVGEDLKE